jgi:hypothetical protein
MQMTCLKINSEVRFYLKIFNYLSYGRRDFIYLFYKTTSEFQQ